MSGGEEIGGDDARKSVLPRKPREYLEDLEIGFDNGITVPADHVDAFRIAASRLKMRGMKFRSKMTEDGINMWRVK